MGQSLQSSDSSSSGTISRFVFKQQTLSLPLRFGFKLPSLYRLYSVTLNHPCVSFVVSYGLISLHLFLSLFLAFLSCPLRSSIGQSKQFLFKSMVLSYWKFRPVNGESFLSTVAWCLFWMENCTTVKIWMRGSLAKLCFWFWFYLMIGVLCIFGLEIKLNWTVFFFFVFCTAEVSEAKSTDDCL